MTHERDFDRIAQAFMADGPTVLADRVLDTALDEVHLTSQRRVLLAWPWRTTSLNTYGRLAVVAVAVVAVGLGGLTVFNQQPLAGSGGSPSPSPSPAPSPSPSGAAVPAMTEPFTSSWYGYSIRYPANWTAHPAETFFDPADPEGTPPESSDLFGPPAGGLFRVASALVPEGENGLDWIETKTAGGPAHAEDVLIGGQPAKLRDLSDTEGEVEAILVADGRVYVLTMFYGEESRAVFDALVATIELRPEDALAAAPRPGPSTSNLQPGPLCTATACRTGTLDPGEYSIEAGSYAPARLTFTVPAGWAMDADGFLTRHAGALDEVHLSTWIVTHVYADICSTNPTLVDAGTTIDQLASLLATQKGRVASPVTDVTLGGVPAKRIALTVPPDLDVTKCAGRIRFWPDPGPSTGGGLCCAAVGSTDVVYVVDAAGERFAIVARHQVRTNAEDVAELQGILDSIVIELPELRSATPSP